MVEITRISLRTHTACKEMCHSLFRFGVSEHVGEYWSFGESLAMSAVLAFHVTANTHSWSPESVWRKAQGPTPAGAESVTDRAVNQACCSIWLGDSRQMSGGAPEAQRSHIHLLLHLSKERVELKGGTRRGSRL